MDPSSRRSARPPARSGPWSLERGEGGLELCYRPSKSNETLRIPVSREQLAAARVLAGRHQAAAVRDLLLTPGLRSEALAGSAISSVISSNTWRWVLPLFGGPPPAGREPARKTPARRR